MSFWIFTAAIALVASGVMVVAMLRTKAAATEASASFDVQVYRDQLKELERDMARGTIRAEEGARAKVEISRRLLEADKKAQAGSQAGTAPTGLTYGMAALSVAVVIGGGYALYDRMGAAGYPDMGLETRKATSAQIWDSRDSQAEVEAALPAWAGPPPEAPADYLDLVDRLRAAVATRPDDLDGQKLLADHESALGNFVAAHVAQTRVVALKGAEATAGDYAKLADMLILSAEGYVSPEAEAALTRALELDPGNKVARFYIGIMYDQSGRPDIAFPVWRQLVEEGPVTAPWMRPILANIENMAARAGTDYTAPSLPSRRPMPLPAGDGTAPPSGPSAEDIAAAEEMSDDARKAMIEGMVNQLMERLATEGGPVEDWARLINVLGVVGDTERARVIHAEALQVFADDEEGLALLNSAAQTAGVSE